MIAEAVATMARAVVLVVFLVSLTGKLRDLPSFRGSVRGFRLVPRRSEPALVAAVCLVEALVLVLTASGRWTTAGLALAVVVLAAFTGGILRVLRAGARVSCGCFGPSAAPLTVVHVVRNVALVLVAGAGLAASLSARTGGGAGTDGGPVLVAASLVAAALVLAGLWALDGLAGPPPARRLPVPPARAPRPSREDATMTRPAHVVPAAPRREH